MTELYDKLNYSPTNDKNLELAVLLNDQFYTGKTAEII